MVLFTSAGFQKWLAPALACPDDSASLGLLLCSLALGVRTTGDAASVITALLDKEEEDKVRDSDCDDGSDASSASDSEDDVDPDDDGLPLFISVVGAPPVIAACGPCCNDGGPGDAEDQGGVPFKVVQSMFEQIMLFIILYGKLAVSEDGADMTGARASQVRDASEGIIAGCAAIKAGIASDIQQTGVLSAGQLLQTGEFIRNFITAAKTGTTFRMPSTPTVYKCLPWARAPATAKACVESLEAYMRWMVAKDEDYEGPLDDCVNSLKEISSDDPDTLEDFRKLFPLHPSS